MHGCADEPVSKIRLANGRTGHDGRVEILRFGQWGTICDDYWDINDARVICRELGFLDAIEATNGSYHGNGTGPIWLSEVNCKGTERAIDDCAHPPFGKHYCDHGDDVGVICDGKCIIRRQRGATVTVLRSLLRLTLLHCIYSNCHTVLYSYTMLDWYITTL